MQETMRLLVLPFVFAALAVAQTAMQDAANLLSNGDFETNLEGWDATRDGGMSVAKPEAAHNGELGLRVSDDDEVKGSSLSSARLPARPGKTYELTFWARMMSGRGAGVYIQFFDDQGAAIVRKNDDAGLTPIREDAWRQYTLLGTAPVNAATIRVWIHTDDAARAIVDVDDVSLVEKR